MHLSGLCHSAPTRALLVNTGLFREKKLSVGKRSSLFSHRVGNESKKSFETLTSGRPEEQFRERGQRRKISVLEGKMD